MKRFLLSVCFTIIIVQVFATEKPDFTVKKIWSGAPHNAFTDLIRYNNKFYCTFREASGHVPGVNGTDGKIRILESKDGEVWQSLALLEKKGYDLRDSKLSITPKGKLMVVMGGSNYDGNDLINRLPHISFFDKKKNRFTDPVPLKIDKRVRSDYDWLWRVTWNYSEKVGYGVMYQKKDNSGTSLQLMKTKDGKKYGHVVTLDVTNLPSEGSVIFTNEGEMLILQRCDQKGNNHGLIGRSHPPYQDWVWIDAGVHLGGPNMIPLTNGMFVAGSRSFDCDNKSGTSLFLYNTKNNKFSKIIDLPSGGDTSYPGMLIYHNQLWFSYYSSHEGKAEIYLAKINLDTIKSFIR